jgi:hypothetical protein
MKILVSIISYKEGDLLGTVLDCYEKARNKESLLFSIVEEHYPEFYSDLSFVPENQMLYRRFDLSKYRGILWARDLTTRNLPSHYEYDYVLFICGHTRFEEGWDIVCLSEYEKAKNKSVTNKAVLTLCPPDFEYNEDWSIKYKNKVKTNLYHPSITGWDPRTQSTSDFIPGYWFPIGHAPPEDNDVHENYWIHFTWCFADKSYVEEVPLDPEMNFNGEEPYVSLQSWGRGWRMFATSKIFAYHHLSRQYPGEKLSRYNTARPWADDKKNDHWEHSRKAMLKLNMLFSGKLEGKYGGISLETVQEYCRKSGINLKWTEYNADYDKIDGYQHMSGIKNNAPVTREELDWKIPGVDR